MGAKAEGVKGPVRSGDLLLLTGDVMMEPVTQELAAPSLYTAEARFRLHG